MASQKRKETVKNASSNGVNGQTRKAASKARKTSRRRDEDRLKPAIDINDPSLYLNRELSWLAFNERVLEEAENPSNPLLERLKFLAIFSSNLDEFFQVRVAGLKEQVKAGLREKTPDGRTPDEQLAQISDRAHELVDRQYRCLNDSVLPALSEAGVLLRTGKQLTSHDRLTLSDYFKREIYPTLTPMAVDPAHPFPHLSNKSLSIAVMLEKRSGAALEKRFALVPVPTALGRLIAMDDLPGAQPTAGCEQNAFTLLGEIIKLHLSDLFSGLFITEAAFVRITRNSELYLDEETEDLLAAIEQELRNRHRGEAVRLEIGANASESLVGKLTEELNLAPDDVYYIDGPLDLTFAWGLVGLPGFDELRDPPHTPQSVADLQRRNGEEPSVIFQRIREKDVLVHHPYESFGAVEEFLDAAADDERVLAIKQTLYRTTADSTVLAALERAAARGKQVTALMELKARFDEENNITWAKRLERAGVHVVYGIVGHKTHCKVALVVRRDEDGLRQYVHLGTGNYNSKTARIYTDLGLLTCDAQLGEDAASLFNLLTGFAEVPVWNNVCVAPMDMAHRVAAWIDREREKHLQHGRGRIIIKCNSLVDPKLIRKLYLASCAGVEIDLIVRGICCLRPGVPGVSENIRVRSIVDRFLEHSRIFYFRNGHEPEEVWIGSADLMPRNLYRRIEVLFPIEQADHKKRVIQQILGANLRDNVHARELHEDGIYRQVQREKARPYRMQQALAERAAKHSKAARKRVVPKKASNKRIQLTLRAAPKEIEANPQIEGEGINNSGGA